MAQQTAVEWFVQQLEESGIDMGNGIKMAYPIPYDIYKEAKAMEKDHIIESWLAGENDGSLEPKAFVEMAEQYYNETFEL